MTPSFLARASRDRHSTSRPSARALSSGDLTEEIGHSQRGRSDGAGEGWEGRGGAARRASASEGTAGEGRQDGNRAAYLRAARKEAQDRIARGGLVLAGLKALTVVMQIDVLLFGRVRSGPFFALLEKRAG